MQKEAGDAGGKEGGEEGGVLPPPLWRRSRSGATAEQKPAAVHRDVPVAAAAAAAMEPGGRRGRAAEEGPLPEEEEVDPRIQVRAPAGLSCYCNTWGMSIIIVMMVAFYYSYIYTRTYIHAYIYACARAECLDTHRVRGGSGSGVPQSFVTPRPCAGLRG